MIHTCIINMHIAGTENTHALTVTTIANIYCIVTMYIFNLIKHLLWMCISYSSGINSNLL